MILLLVSEVSIWEVGWLHHTGACRGEQSAGQAPHLIVIGSGEIRGARVSVSPSGLYSEWPNSLPLVHLFQVLPFRQCQSLDPKPSTHGPWLRRRIKWELNPWGRVRVEQVTQSLHLGGQEGCGNGKQQKRPWHTQSRLRSWWPKVLWR